MFKLSNILSVWLLCETKSQETKTKKLHNYQDYKLLMIGKKMVSMVSLNNEN